MALNENFWNDIDDLDEEDNDEIEEEDEDNDEQNKNNNKNLDNDKIYQKQNEKALTTQQSIEQLKQDFQKKHTEYSLLKDEIFKHLVIKVDQYLEQDLKSYSHAINTSDEEYQLIVKCNEYLNNVDREIMVIHKTCRDIYFERYPELEQIVLNPIDYCKVVQQIQNESDLNKVDLSNILNSHQIVTVKVTGSSTSGKLLSSDKLNEALLQCDQVLQLDQYKKQLLLYVQSRMEYIAPNLSNLIGSNIASKLMAAAGGLEALANIPSCNIQVLGSQKKNILGLNKTSGGQKLHMGFFGELEMVKLAPEKFQIKLVRRLSNNCAKAARVDLNRTHPDGSLGAHFKEEMMQKFMKIQEPPPPKKIKPLVIDDKPKKKRGGKKFRKMKERLGLTDVRKLAQRMNFGPEEEQQFRQTGKGFGMLGVGAGGSGKVKLNTSNNKVKLSKKQQMLAKKVQLKGSSGATGGISSSIAFTPIQAMELVNPEIMKAPAKKNPDQYFNKETGFKTVVENKKKQTTEFDNIFGKI